MVVFVCVHARMTAKVHKWGQGPGQLISKREYFINEAIFVNFRKKKTEH